MKSTTKSILGLSAALALVGGCVRKETTHTLYLRPDGAVTWITLEKYIRSDEEDPQERRDEDEAFLAGVRSGEHKLTRALEMLGATSVEARILRDERPYMVMTEARFGSIDEVIQSFMDQAGAPINAELSREGDRVRLTISCDLAALAESTQQESSDDDRLEVLEVLLEDAENYRVVLTEGEFVDARGLTIEEEGTLAVLVEQDEDQIAEIEEVDDDGNVVIYSLTWTIDNDCSVREGLRHVPEV